jgi:hypothetical protein
MEDACEPLRVMPGRLTSLPDSATARHHPQGLTRALHEVPERVDTSAAFGSGFFFQFFSAWNNRFWGPQPLWAKTDPGNGFSSQSIPCDAAAHLGARPIPEELIRGLGTCVFSRNRGHFGLICDATTGFPLEFDLHTYRQPVWVCHAKGEVERLRRWRASSGWRPFGALNAPAGP